MILIDLADNQFIRFVIDRLLADSSSRGISFCCWAFATFIRRVLFEERIIYWIANLHTLSYFRNAVYIKKQILFKNLDWYTDPYENVELQEIIANLDLQKLFKIP